MTPSPSMPSPEKALTPVIISASRATDIPAFYAPWLMQRLREGHCVWHNPFNAKASRVSFEKTRAIVFWTKNPAPLVPFLDELDGMGLGYYFQHTLNDYEQEGLEPGLPPLASRIATFRQLAQRLGPERVIWRFDPIILGGGLTPAAILGRIRAIGSQLAGCTEKLVFSFVDVAAYRKVQLNLAKTGLFSRETVLEAEAGAAQVDEICAGLAALRDEWHTAGWKVRLATCGEGVDLARYRIGHNRCIDDVLLRRLYPHDAALMAHLGAPLPSQPAQGSLLSLPSKGENRIEANPKLKDRGQRKECGCIASKDIGMYNTCAHFCSYCYANASVELVRKNRARHRVEGKSIVDAEPCKA